MVEAEIRRLEDYMEHTERDTVRAERRLEELVKREEADREKDRRTRQRMGARPQESTRMHELIWRPHT